MKEPPLEGGLKKQARALMFKKLVLNRSIIKQDACKLRSIDGFLSKSTFLRRIFPFEASMSCLILFHEMRHN